MNTEITNTSISALKLYEKNNKQHPKEQIDKIASSIKEFGFRQPVLIDKEGVLIAGHGRVLAAKQLGLSVVPCLVVDDLSPEQIRAFRIADNRSAISDWDYDSLKSEFSDLKQLNYDLGLTLFDQEEIDEILGIKSELIDVEPEEYEKVKTDIKLGDLFIIGNHKVLCGDSTDMKNYELLFEGGGKSKLVFTSPPYNMASNMYENYEDNKNSDEYIDFNMVVVRNCEKFLNGYLFWNISYNKNTRWEFIEIMYNILKKTNLRFLELIVWDKGHGLPIVSKDMLTRSYEDILFVGDDETVKRELEMYFVAGTGKRAYFNKKKGKGITNYWKIGTNNTQLKNHLACFPIGLPAKAMELCTNENDIVLDPFLGSGSTMIASENLKRKCYGIELDPIYCEITIKRIEALTGQNRTKK
jgi:DNA modification methylase